MVERQDYENAFQRELVTRPANVALGSFGASTCVIVAAVNTDGTHTVAHIDTVTPSLILKFQGDSKLTMMYTGQNGRLLATLLATQLPGTVTIIRGSSLMVCDGVVTPDVGPPVEVDTTIFDKRSADFVAQADAVLAMPKEHDRPPAPGMNYYWSVFQRKWLFYEAATCLDGEEALFSSFCCL